MLLYYFQIQDLISGLVRKHQLNFDLIEFEIMMCNYDGKKKKKPVLFKPIIASKTWDRFIQVSKTLDGKSPGLYPTRPLACYLILN